MKALSFAVIVLFAAMLSSGAQAQWTIQKSGVSAELRGIDNVGEGVAWAAGSQGTVLRTVDGGEHWERCAVPSFGQKASDSEMLDFRAVQGLDAKTAIVMSSGLGSLSRLYKTVDGCRTWKLVLTNPDKEGCFDALKMNLPLISMAKEKVYQGRLVGDPVDRKFVEFDTEDGGDHWTRAGSEGYPMPLALDGERPLPVSNSAVLFFPNGSDLLVTAGVIGAHSHVLAETIRGGKHTMKYVEGNLPMSSYVADAGAASVAIASTGGGAPHVAPDDKERVLYVDSGVLVAVGGDEAKANVEKGTAAFSTDSGAVWKAAAVMPRGYRSSVAYDAATKTWIAVGPNGTDVSNDNGQDWRGLFPGTGEAADADKGWNALSLPFVVGAKGRIGVMRSNPLEASK